ncbi:MAG: hypothetical protein AABM29_04820 [Actinomycetota bacterium]
MSGFFAAIDSDDRNAALRFIAPQPELIGFDISASGELLLRAESPVAAYRGLRALAKTGNGLSLLGAAVGAPGPFPNTRTGEKIDRESAGADFSITAGSRFGSGKNGINCETGQFYVWAMNLTPFLRREPLCRDRRPISRARLEELRENPVVCAY